MVNVIKHGVILKNTSFGFENVGILNPTIVHEGNKVHLFFRTVSLGNYSIIGYCIFDGLLNIAEQFDLPDLFPQADYESQGLAYPQIIKIDDPYYLANTSYTSVNAPRAYATNKSLPCFGKHGLLAPQLSYKIETYPLFHAFFMAQKI